MPQMAPLSWLILFVYFLMIFIIYNVMNYYMFYYSVKLNLMNKKMNSINWKW
uniref:ATP synthase complex subunit 8 n=1 Tax=Cucujoidea sp. 2 KM-2017 TaxID=2219356 RepID=A0A346RJI6_9CUCU|nr:ATP synthase F0 subunit 8 [Cucujoidea sp. 2 KM-2017]